jgi:hypothetical protein
MENKIDLSKLADKFHEKDLDWRAQRTGLTKDGSPWAIVVPYVDARAIMDRLDAVVGPGNWQDEYEPSGKGFICSLGIKIDGEWVWKQDGSDETDIEPFKGGLSKALVRAAVKWGIGRYLYDMKEEFADFAQVDKKTKGAKGAKIKEETYYWLPPKVPGWALPSKGKEDKKPEEKPIDTSIPPKRTKEELQEEIMQLCARRSIKPAELRTIAADKMNVNNHKDLDVDGLEKLLAHIEELGSR